MFYPLRLAYPHGVILEESAQSPSRRQPHHRPHGSTLDLPARITPHGANGHPSRRERLHPSSHSPASSMPTSRTPCLPSPASSAASTTLAYPLKNARSYVKDHSAFAPDTPTRAFGFHTSCYRSSVAVHCEIGQQIPGYNLHHRTLLIGQPVLWPA